MRNHLPEEVRMNNLRGTAAEYVLGFLEPGEAEAFRTRIAADEELRALLYYLIDSVLDHAQPERPAVALTAIG